MKRLVVVLALLSLLSIPAFAGDAPKFEIFGGYSLIHSGEVEELDLCALTYHGFSAAVEGNVKPYLGIVGEFSFYQKTTSETMSEDSYEYGYEEKLRHFPILFGPRVGYRGDKFRVFAHYLLGFAKTTWDYKEWDEYYDDEYSESDSDTNFSQAIGGGVDIVVNDMLSIRPAQMDLLSIKVSDGDSYWINSFRYSGGIVLTFGK
jgi:opacity protein-like surface antigen